MQAAAPGVAEPETVAAGQGFLSLPPDCAQAAFSLGDAKAGDGSVLVQQQVLLHH